METEDIGIMALIGMFFIAIGGILGSIVASPNELENGCIVHNDKVYCEVDK